MSLPAAPIDAIDPIDPIAPPARRFALVPCAGVGARAGAGLPKQYAPVAGQAMVRHTLRALQALVAAGELKATLVVIAPADRHFEALVPEAEFDRRWLARAGGATRASSVLAGLAALRERGARDADWVLVHDAARCLLQPAWVQRLLDAVDPMARRAGTAAVEAGIGGLLAMPLADTIKHDDGQGAVAHTVPRGQLWAAQTPQMFRLGLLQQALLRAQATGAEVTDEASAVEVLGHRPRLVRGEWENLKLTWPADFALAERLLESR